MSPRLKPLTYGLMHLVVAVAVAYALTRSWQAALAIGLVEPFVQTFAYAIHERLWAGRGGIVSAHAHGGHAHPHIPKLREA